MTLAQLEEERKRLEARLALINVRCPAMDRIKAEIDRINAKIAQAAS